MNKIDWERYERELEDYRDDHASFKYMVAVVVILATIFLSIAMKGIFS